MKVLLTGLAVLGYFVSLIGGITAIMSGGSISSIVMFIAGNITHSILSMIVLYIDNSEKLKFEKELLEKVQQQIQKEKINALNPHN